MFVGADRVLFSYHCRIDGRMLKSELPNRYGNASHGLSAGSYHSLRLDGECAESDVNRLIALVPSATQEEQVFPFNQAIAGKYNPPGAWKGL